MEKDDLYDVLDEDGGVERALAKLDTIKDEIVCGPQVRKPRSFWPTARS